MSAKTLKTDMKARELRSCGHSEECSKKYDGVCRECYEQAWRKKMRDDVFDVQSSSTRGDMRRQNY